MTVAAREAGPAQLELWASAGQAKRLGLGRTAKRIGQRTVALPAGAPTTTRVRLTARAAKRLRRARRASLSLAVLRDAAPLAVVPVRLKR